MSAGDELVDILNESGDVVGVTTRREMRANRLPHRCVYLLVFNSVGEIFVHLRTATKDIFPSHWDVAAGGVPAAGENWDQAALREGQEELGVRLSLEPLFPFHYADELSVVHGMVYRAIHDGPFVLQPEEVVQGEFLSVGQALAQSQRQPFCPDGIAVLREYLRITGAERS
jgi:isopentenyldiphosphate isomerase